jgi:hypothetical protein
MPVKVIVLDANLLLLLAVGLTSRAYISNHKRLQGYEEPDFDLLTGLIGSAAILVTPNTLTETSNLARQIKEPARTQISRQLRQICTILEEHYVQSSRAAGYKEFLRLGLADAAQLDLAGASHTLLTVDLDLYLAAVGRGLKAENFNHYRAM